VQGEGKTAEPTADLAPKEEPTLPSQHESATALPPVSHETSSEPSTQLQTHERSEPEQTAVSTDTLAESRETHQIANESISHPNTQEYPSTAIEREQPNPSDAPRPSLHSEEAKDVMMGDVPAPEQSQALDAQSLANQDLPQAPPIAENTQPQPTPAESTTAAATDERTEATTESNVPDQSIAAEPKLQEAKEANDELEKLPDSIPQAGPSEST
jgi:hypothetical protein